MGKIKITIKNYKQPKPKSRNQTTNNQKNEIPQSETGYGEQVWCLRAHSTTPQVLDCSPVYANGIAETIS